MSAEARNPFPGPRPFRTDEAHFFFGREQESRDLFSLVTAHREILMYAESGSGKTSLLNAGLAPLLEKNGFVIFPPARMGVATPASVAPQQIANVFAFKTALQWLEVEPQSLTSATIKDAVETVARKSAADSPRVVIFDQFEELFTADLDRWRDREGFFEQIAEALRGDPLLRAIFVIREDYIAQLEPFAPLLPSRLRMRIRLARLGRDAALDAISCPLKMSGRRFDNGVAEKLVDDLLKIRVETKPGEIAEVEGEYVEPVQLQVVCQTLCNEMSPSETVVRREHLDKIGNIDRILACFYEDAVRDAAAAAGVLEETVRTWCGEILITSLGTRGTVYRERDSTGKLPNAAIDILDEKHLIRAERRAAVRWYELTHDRFIEPIRSSNAEFLRSESAASSALSDADNHWRRGRLDAASEEFERALQHYLRTGNRYISARIVHAIGEIRHEMRRDDEALTYLATAASTYRELAVDDGLSAALTSIGRIHFDRNKFDEAIEAYTAALSTTPDNATLHDARAAAFWYSGNLEKAIEDYSVVLDRDPDNVRALNGRGQARAEYGLFALAVADLTKAIDLAEKNLDLILIAYASNGRGLAYGGLRQFRDAMRDFDRSISLAPNNAWVYFNRAQVYLWKKKTKAAIADLQASLEFANPALNPTKRTRAMELLKEHGAK